MIRVIVELRPSQSREVFPLGVIDISNTSNLAPLSNYAVKVEFSGIGREGESKSIEHAEVYAHRRDEGWQKLVLQAFRALQQGSVRVKPPSVAVCQEAIEAFDAICLALPASERGKHGGDREDVRRVLFWTRLHAPAFDEPAELERLRSVIRTGGALYRLERAAMGHPGGVDAALSQCSECPEDAKHLIPYCSDHKPGPSRHEVVTAAKGSIVDAAVGWWLDHDREQCHFCRPQPSTSHVSGDVDHPDAEVIWNHDERCPVGEYIAALGGESSQVSPTGSEGEDGGSQP